jgi:hypothetical protein
LSSGTIRNIGVANGSVNGDDLVGGLVGENDGTVANSYAAGVVDGGTSTFALLTPLAGGLVGINRGTISNSYASGAVNGGNGTIIGGLAGYNASGAITDSYATSVVSAGGTGPEGNGSDAGGLVGYNNIDGSTITNSYASGAVSAGGNSVIGGLLGGNGGLVTDSYATGAVSGNQTNYYVGGLAGTNSGAITNSYATGVASGPASEVGGLVGNNGGGTIGDSYWDTQTSGLSHSIGIDTNNQSGNVIGLTTAQLSFALPSGLNSTVWGNVNNQTTPYLLSNPGPVYIGSDGSHLFTLVFTMAELQAINDNLNCNFALANSLNAAVDPSTPSSWIPIGTDGTGNVGNSGNGFAGIFDGLGNTISNLAVNLPSLNYVGAFGYSSGVIRNVGIIGGVINGDNNTGGLVGESTGAIDRAFATDSVYGSLDAFNVGGLAGSNYGSIVGSYATGSVGGLNPVNLGGLVGFDSGPITDSYATGAVSGYYETGGLVGYLEQASITAVYATGSVYGSGGDDGGLVGVSASGVITDAVAAGAVNGGNGSGYIGGLVGENAGSISDASSASTVRGEIDVGGLAGVNFGTITNAFATGPVSGYTGSEIVGGLVGENIGTIGNTYATGVASGDSRTGGLIGQDDMSSGHVTNSYWDVLTSGIGMLSGAGNISDDPGIAGLVTVSLQSTLPAGFNNTIWRTGTGLYPYFQWQYPSGTPQAVSGIAYSNGEGAVLNTGTVSLLVNGYALGTVSSGANGYYYFLEAPGTISNNSAVLAYSSADGARVEVGAQALDNNHNVSNFDVWGNTLIAPTGDTTYSSASASGLQTQDASLIAQAVGSNDNPTIGLTNYGYIATGNGFTINQLLTLSNGLYVQTTAGHANISIVDPITAPGAQQITLDATGNIAIGKPIAIGGTIDLVAGGNISENASTGSIAAAELTGSAGSATTLNGNNQLAQLGAFTNAGGNLQLTDDQALTIVGRVNVGNYALTLVDFSDIAESGGGLIDAKAFEGASSGGADLNGANLIANLDTFTNSGAGGFTLNDGETLTVNGAVGAGSGNLTLTASNAGSNIAIDDPVFAGGTIDLVSAATISQSGIGIITAGTLTGSAGGATVLNTANQIANLGAFTNTGGNLALTDDRGLTITGPVNAGAHSVTLTVFGTLSESGAGLVDAKSPGGTSSGGTALNGANLVADLIAFTNSGPGGFALTDDQTVTIEGVVNAGTGALALSTVGAGANIVIDSAIMAGGTVTLTSAGAISEANNTGVITGATLSGSAGTSALLRGNNKIANLGSFASTAGFALTDDQSLTVSGIVNAGVNNIALQVMTGDLVIDGAMNGTVVTLGSSTGEVDGTGAITAKTLNVTANTGIDLTGPNHIKKIGVNHTNSGPDIINP